MADDGYTELDRSGLKRCSGREMRDEADTDRSISERAGQFHLFAQPVDTERCAPADQPEPARRGDRSSEPATSAVESTTASIAIAAPLTP